MKTEQLQIRVSRGMKAAIRDRAQAANMDMSEWVLQVLFPPAEREFQELVAKVVKEGRSPERFYAFAELSEFLQGLESDVLSQAVGEKPEGELDEFSYNYIAAMVEVVCQRKKITPPNWTEEAGGLTEPYFGSSMLSLRLYLLQNSPVPFKKRNIFIDSSVGDRV